MNKTKLAKELIEEKSVDGKCTLSKKKLGEILHQRHPTEFKDAEYGRVAIRRSTGTAGDKMRKQIIYSRTDYEFKLPKPEKNDYRKFIVHGKRIGILSDIHLPYYDEQALQAAIAYLKKWKPDTIILNGDIIDAYHLSRFEKDSRNRSFKYELDMLKEFFNELKRIFKNVHIVFVCGNHESRYEKMILQRIPELVDLGLFSFENVIDARNLGIEVVSSKRLVMAGKLNIGHGHEMPVGIAAPVNPARGFFLKTKANFLGGHFHQHSSHMESDINGKQIGAWSTGCLCDLHPSYMPINKWSHGFATVEVEKGGEFHVDNLKIINGRVV